MHQPNESGVQLAQAMEGARDALTPLWLTAGPNCWAIVHATRRLKTSPDTMLDGAQKMKGLTPTSLPPNCVLWFVPLFVFRSFLRSFVYSCFGWRDQEEGRGAPVRSWSAQELSVVPTSLGFVVRFSGHGVHVWQWSQKVEKVHVLWKHKTTGCAILSVIVDGENDFAFKMLRRNSQGDSNAPITKCQESLCGEITKQRTRPLWAEQLLKS